MKVVHYAYKSKNYIRTVTTIYDQKFGFVLIYLPNLEVRPTRNRDILS